MLLFIRSSGAVTLSAGETSTLSTPIPVTQGGTPLINLQFINDAGVIYQPDQSPNVISSLKFIGKALGDYYGGDVVSNSNGTSFVYTVSGTGSSAVYSVPVSFATLPLLNLLVAPAAIAATPANIAARYALTSLTKGQTVLQADTKQYWTVIDATNLGNSAGWSQGVFYQTVANQTARYALTGIPNGTLVVQSDTAIPWMVVDATNLSNANGWSADVPITPTGFVDLGCQVELNVNAGTVTESSSFPMRVSATYITGTEGLALLLTLYPALNNVQFIVGTAATTLDFNGGGMQTLSIAANTTLATTNLASGKSITVKITETSGTARTLTFPTGWTWSGGVKPATVPGNGTLTLALMAWGSTDSTVQAAGALFS